MKAKKKSLGVDDLYFSEFKDAEIYLKPLDSKSEVSKYKINKVFTNIAYLDNLSGVYFFH
jgi:hypothetical protein